MFSWVYQRTCSICLTRGMWVWPDCSVQSCDLHADLSMMGWYCSRFSSQQSAQNLEMRERKKERERERNIYSRKLLQPLSKITNYVQIVVDGKRYGKYRKIQFIQLWSTHKAYDDITFYQDYDINFYDQHSPSRESSAGTFPRKLTPVDSPMLTARTNKISFIAIIALLQIMQRLVAHKHQPAQLVTWFIREIFE